MLKRLMPLAALLLAFALVAAACGDDDDATTTTADAGGETTTTEAMAETTTTAASGGETTTTAAAAAGGVSCDEPVKVGLITDETGGLAIYGAHILRSFPIGMEYVTGAAGTDGKYMLDNCEIEVIVKDDQSDPETTATVGRELIEVDGVDILVGTVSSGATASLQELAADNNVILIAAPAAAVDITGKDFHPNTFRASRHNYQDSIAICDQFVNGDGMTSFVQIAPDYSFGYGGAQAYKDACTFFGGEFIADDVFAPADTTDFTSFLEPLADSGADAFLVTWAGGGFVPLDQAARDLSVINDTTVLGSPFVDNVVMPSFFANAIGTTSVILYHYTTPQNNAINDYLIAKAAEGGAIPDLFDADGMNAAIMVGEALKATGGAADADSLRAALEGMTFEGPKGTIQIRAEDHTAIQDMYIVTLLNVDDPEFKYYEYVNTVRPEPPCLLEGEYLDRCGSLPVGTLTGG